jgi:hypothetical protein
MPDKWQQINLRLEAPLAQALRELKRGHDESLSEVILRLLWKAVRQNPAARGAPDARSSARGGRAARGTYGAGRGPKPPAREDRGGSRGAAKGKPFAPREVADGDTWAPSERKRRPATASAPPRASRRFTGKPGKAFRPQPAEGERWGRGAAEKNRDGDDTSRGFPAGSATSGGARPMRRPRKAKGRRPGRG